MHDEQNILLKLAICHASKPILDFEIFNIFDGKSLYIMVNCSDIFLVGQHKVHLEYENCICSDLHKVYCAGITSKIMPPKQYLHRVPIKTVSLQHYQ